MIEEIENLLRYRGLYPHCSFCSCCFSGMWSKFSVHMAQYCTADNLVEDLIPVSNDHRTSICQDIHRIPCIRLKPEDLVQSCGTDIRWQRDMLQLDACSGCESWQGCTRPAPPLARPSAPYRETQATTGAKRAGGGHRFLASKSCFFVLHAGGVFWRVTGWIRGTG